jgi:hypothetical protein
VAARLHPRAHAGAADRHLSEQAPKPIAAITTSTQPDAAAISPDGRLLAYALPGELHLVDVTRRKEVARLAVAPHGRAAVAFVGRLVEALGDLDAARELVRVREGALVRRLQSRDGSPWSVGAFVAALAAT